MNKTMKKLISVALVLCTILLCACSVAKNTSEIRYRYASREEGQELLLSNQAYYDEFSQNDLEYKLQKKDATMEEYIPYAKEQVQDFTEEEKTLIGSYLTGMKEKLKENGYVLPAIDEIVFIKTSMKEENGAGGYTHGTQIYINAKILDDAINGDEKTKEKESDFLTEFFWHELFHCLTRCNPEFRAQMYELIHFTVGEKEFPIPPSVKAYYISNPDVEHHNSYASFRIDGNDIDCFCALITTKHFEKEGESFFKCATTALVPIDGSDVYYTPEQAENFNEIFGKNTDYVTDPEECIADNFAYAMAYGLEGEDGKGYPNPEIIEGILSYVSSKK